MKYYIKSDGHYYMSEGNGVTNLINKAHPYEKEDAIRIAENNGLLEHQYTLVEYKAKYKLLILGDARHGKDTLAEMLCEKADMKFAGSSRTALDIFMMDVLQEKYSLSYSSKEEAYADRVNHRDKWYNEICLYNEEDKLRLVKDILKVADIYVGLRNFKEVEQAVKEDTFDYIVGVYDYRKPREDKSSNTADVFKYSDFVIMNNGTIDNLRYKVVNILLKVLV